MSPSTFYLFCLLLIFFFCQAGAQTRFTSTCIDDAPVVPEVRTGCGVLPFMDQDVFGNNANSRGFLTATPQRHGVKFSIRLKQLSRPNLVLTAWLIYALPRDPNNPNVFNVRTLQTASGTLSPYSCYLATNPSTHHLSLQFGNIAAPLAPTHAGFTSGLGREPNQFRYTSRKSARLEVNLDFNPFFPNEGPLGFSSFCSQKDIPGIQSSAWKQPRIQTVGVPYPGDVFVPAGSQYLRQYDPKTGFERLDARGRPMLVRSPLRAFAVAVAGHIDKTTHGLSPGIFAGDHWEVMSFVLNGKVGRRTQRGD